MPKNSEAKLRANAKYAKDHVKQILLRFYPRDYDVYDYLMAKGTDKTSYVKGLIRADMEKGEREPEGGCHD